MQLRSWHRAIGHLLQDLQGQVPLSGGNAHLVNGGLTIECMQHMVQADKYICLREFCRKDVSFVHVLIRNDDSDLIPFLNLSL